MKQIFKWSLILVPIFAAGCQEDVVAPEPTLIGYEEGDVVFTVANDPKTRTMYDDNEWDSKNSQSIYWGNYISTDEDKIKVYCKAASQQPICSYKVNPQSIKNSVAESIEKLTLKSMQWGSQNEDHNFYGFYPAEMAGDAFIGNTDNTIRAQVTPGQSPKQYKRSVNGGAIEVTTLQTIAANTTASLSNKTVIYGDPDMEGAIMVAKTTVPAGSTNFGKPVPLEFNVMADVLDLTINGPIKPNSLGGNAGESDVERNYIKIRSVTIKNAKNGTKILSGSFDINMQTGKVSNVSGNTSVQIITADEGQYPTLHVRQTVADENTVPKPEEIDQLRLRAFLIPGQITNLGDLEVVVDTDCGEYKQTLENVNSFISGKINPIKLSYFKTRGTPFDYSRWIGQLDPNIYISELSIPGSWHSSNTNNQGDVTLRAQYEAGVRAFEVHTTNGTIPKVWGDLNTNFDEDKAKTATYYDEQLNYSDNNGSTPVIKSGGEPQREGILSSKWTRSNCTVEQTRTVTYQQKPQFGLRLYRTRNITGDSGTALNPTASFSDALINLANIMNEDGFMIFEFGMDNPTYPNSETVISRTVNVNCKTVTLTYTRRKTGVTVSGTGYTSSNITWHLDEVFTDADSWGEPTENVDYSNTISIDNGEAWAIAIRSCLKRLEETNQSKTGEPILMTDPVTPNTTIYNARGHVIAKINTNGTTGSYANEGNYWTDNTNALFSRWVAGSGSEPMTINLNWGKPIDPDPLIENNQALRWCYTELENVQKVEDRENAIKALGNEAYNNYKGGLHRTFYECAIGGYTGTNNADGCQSLAKSLNPYLLNVLTDPTRSACPFGIVFMNFVIAPNDDQDTYKSKELIRTIINNNAAFLLNRQGAPTQQVGDNTNSSFTNNSNNPLK